MTEREVQDMYHVMAIANYEDRFVIPSSHREYAREHFRRARRMRFSFGNGCSGGSSKVSIFGGTKRRTIPVKAEV
jgi:nitrate reductase beta subunit